MTLMLWQDKLECLSIPTMYIIIEYLKMYPGIYQQSGAKDDASLTLKYKTRLKLVTPAKYITYFSRELIEEEYYSIKLNTDSK